MTKKDDKLSFNRRFEFTGINKEDKREKMTSIQACKETKELWTEMARFAREERKAVEKFQVTGPWEDYRHNCPCCKYAASYSCLACPMQEEWRVYSKRSSAPCEDPRSPYRQWLNIVMLGSFCIDVEFFCLLIVEMAEEALERHIAES